MANSQRSALTIRLPMQDFLKDRPVLSGDEATIIAPVPSAPNNPSGPFARIVRDGSGVAPARAVATPPAKSGPGANLPADHTSQVRTVVENGRITRLIVTCSCGKVTEIACVY